MLAQPSWAGLEMGQAWSCVVSPVGCASPEQLGEPAALPWRDWLLLLLLHCGQGHVPQVGLDELAARRISPSCWQTSVCAIPRIPNDFGKQAAVF